MKICADDFGLTHGISRAIVALCAAGRIQAASIMTEAAHAAEYAPALLRTGVEIGLHFNLTHRFAAAPYGLTGLMLSPRLGAAARADIAARLRGQHDAFIRIFQRHPDFIDGHQHVHVFPAVRGIFLKTLDDIYRGQTARPWVRQVGGPLTAATDDRRKLAVLRLLNTGFRKSCDRYGFATNKQFSGVYSLAAQAPYAAFLQSWLAGTDRPGLMMCHPSAVLERDDPISAARNAEFMALSALAISKE